MIAIAITAGFLAAFAGAVTVIAASVKRYAPLARALRAELAAARDTRAFAYAVRAPDYAPATARVIMLPARRPWVRQPALRAAA